MKDQNVGLTVGVDLGGTKIAAGAVDPGGDVVTRVRIPTPHDPDRIAEAVAEAVRQVRGGWDDIRAVGVGAAGYVDADRSTVRFAPNLGWHDKAIRDIVQEATGLPVVVENDANAAAWGEFIHGAGAGHDDMLMVMAGTGLGGGIISRGRLFRGRFGMAGEIGHYRAVPDGLPCPCGQRGCMEQYASGAAHTRRAREMATADPARAARVLALGDGTPSGLEGHHVTKAALAGDPFALDVFARSGRWLGQVLADLASILDPSVLVIGGGLGDTGELIRRPAEIAYRRALGGGEHRVYAEVRTATVGADAGIIGAANLARLHELLSFPAAVL
ncbi:ROK family glucokinase [Streptomyces sp. MBT62]|uniref:ROK family glucokinase n=1 Tax=Streptomyces sp. MBT62 TaxID=2800410 RepID=UPI00190C3702|nr:ROK family glucokinase [Streptomyces sp. MBT62]MBK3566415.1 ROK family glucokinase [Streptomyces sp. MBT62]